MLYVYKSMLNKLQNEGRNTIIFILIIIMMTALFVSRSLLSVSMMVFILVSFSHSGLKKQLRTFLQIPLLWGMSLLLIIPLLSGLWCDDKQQWLDIIRIKLPLLFLPLAFAGPIVITKKQGELLAYIFIALITTGTLWCMYHYLQHANEVNEGYLKAKSILTPLENDRVRFSWLLSVAILLAGWLAIKKQKEKKTISVVLMIVTGWLVVFLHILAVRTGLVSLYLILLVSAIWLIIKKINWRYSISLLVLLIVLPLIAYFFIPTFQNRLKYINYDFEYFKKAHYLPGGNDAIRVISVRAGWEITKDNPVAGAGFGDILAEAKKWYELNYPQMTEEDKIYPGSEWMMHGAGSGIPGLLIFTIVMFIPFFVQVKEKLLWYLMNGTSAFSFLFDIGLEVQFGVFAWSFIVLWWWKWLKQ
ncbi:MAG: O-antigen ligase family protein [Chitinophagaceae bacterium]|nr:O-antigen ligase family protein [Chitinophagaceae bacterium]